MYELVRLLPARRLLAEQLPAAFVSLLIAEAFYKFHSFTLECLAFLGTWFLLDLGGRVASRTLGAASFAIRRPRRREEERRTRRREDAGGRR